jgi:hypothetical protein
MTDDNTFISPITFEEAKRLTHGTTIYEIGQYNYDGTARRWLVFGKVRLWVTMPWRIEIPLKHGMYNHDYLTDENMSRFSLDEPVAITRSRQGKPV